MKRNLKDSYKDIDEFFISPPSVNQRAWGLINDFYHKILTTMKKRKISKSSLAKKLGKSRSAVSQMFNKTPNITIKKMVEIVDVLDQVLVLDIRDKSIANEWVLECSRNPTYHTYYVSLAIEAPEGSLGTETWQDSDAENMASVYHPATACN
jgi:transcriptional regulator with XRE-family HTH domain